MTLPTRSTLLACSLLLLPLAGASSATAGSARDSGPEAESARADRRSDFRTKFIQATKINSKTTLEKLFREYPDEVVEWVIETAENIATRPNDALYERMNALRNTWNTVRRTDFVDQIEVYFSLLDGPRKRDRFKLKADYGKAITRFREITDKGGDRKALGAVGVNLAGMATLFAATGDKFYTSRAYLLAGQCYDDHYRGRDADFVKAEEYFRKGCEARKSVGLEDSVYKTTRSRLTALQGLGFGPTKAAAGAEGAGPGAPAGAAAGSAAGGAGAVNASMTFEGLEEYDTFLRPNYFLDDHYPIWGAINLQKKDSKSAVGRMTDFALRAIRTGSAKVGVDVDGDGATDVDIPLRGSPTLIEANIGTGAEARKTGFLAVIGNTTDTYQNTELNLSPQDEQMSIYVVAAGSMVGDINGTPVRVIDEDMDGIYGGKPQSWAHIGLVSGAFQPEMDSIVIGESERAQPWSEFTKIGDAWYKLEAQNGGSTLSATPSAVRTGFLKLDVKGIKPSFVIVQGSQAYENSFFDLAAAKGREVEVPIGVYKLYFGILRKGKKRQQMKALILPGSSVSYAVSEGTTVDVKIGAPFGFDFNTEVNGSELIVDGQSVVITGRGGEHYGRPYGCVPKPEVSMRKAGSKRGGKGKKMPMLISQDDIYNVKRDPKKGYKAAWFPYDLALPIKAGMTEVEVQLVDKKNKLFGKISSEWKK
ncbi:MAG: hypothetical protein ACI8QC_000484 [Planctomycetota bacterium]|jgi:hypothetical protein